MSEGYRVYMEEGGKTYHLRRCDREVAYQRITRIQASKLQLRPCRACEKLVRGDVVK